MPIKVTSASLHERYRNNETGLGEPMAIGLPIDHSNATERVMYQVPDDRVLLLTHLVAQADDGLTLLTQAAGSPTTAALVGMNVGSPSNPHYNPSFLGFRRWQATFDSANTPSWLNAPPGNVVSWKPKYPIVVGPGLQINSGQNAGAFGHLQGAYGYLLSREQAGSLGFPIQPSATEGDRRYAVQSTAGSTSFASPRELLAGRAGRSIRILDVHIRMQPQENELLTLEMMQDDGVTPRTFFKMASANPSDLAEMSFSPDIYLKAGASLDIRTSHNLLCSVNVIAEYVDEEHLPLNHWWSVVDPILPTPSISTGGSYGTAPFEIFTKKSTPVVPYFPGRDAVGPTMPSGHQYIVNGYGFYAQQDNAANTDKLLFTISSGLDEGSIYASAYNLPAQTNYQIAPVFNVSRHDQLTYGVVDDVNLPARGDFGSPSASGDPGTIYIDSAGLGATTGTPTGTMNVISWAVCLWGQIRGVKRSFLTNKGE